MSPPSSPPPPPPAPLSPLPAPQYAPELPADVLRMVLAPLADDVASLCACACVATSWRAAACDPRLWRRLRFPPAAARQLTDATLAALVARVGSALERVNLEGCVRVTARGAATALAGKKLQALAVRGLRTGSARGHSAAGALPLLSALVRRPTGLDVRGGRAALLCGGSALTASGAKPCARLCCAAHDTLCKACGIVRCARCVQAAKAARAPPCSHLCDRCFRVCDDDDEQDVRSDCAACGRPRNGFCDACMHSCDACADADATFCVDCAHAGGALTKCDGDGCDSTYCADCAFDTGDCLTTCSVATCGKAFCDGCAFDGGEIRFCEACNAEFCDACADERLFFDEDTDEMQCVECKASNWDTDEEEDEDEVEDEVLALMFGAAWQADFAEAAAVIAAVMD
jgi:hypothetical protein